MPNGSDTDEGLYGPAQVAAVVVGCFSTVGILYWMLWSLLVCEGGLFSKVIPFLQVVFTTKTLADFGYQGYPYQLGIFEGWIVNVSALFITLATIIGLWHFYHRTFKGDSA